jgi:hypothetical protein
MERTKQQSGALRGSAGGKTSGKDGKDGSGPGLGRSASIAAGSSVSDPLLQAGMLEKVNVLGKQVGRLFGMMWQSAVCRAALLALDCTAVGLAASTASCSASSNSCHRHCPVIFVSLPLLL